MKNLITLFAILLLSFASQAQELNREAKHISTSESFAKEYATIKDNAIKEWGSDSNMVVYEINKQSKAFIQLLDIIDPLEKGMPEYEILVNAMAEWGDDYNMIIYEYEKQLKAYQSL